MKIFIVTDLEGVAGISVDQQLNGVDNPYYRKAREFLADEINAAVAGAKDAGKLYRICRLPFYRHLPESRYLQRKT